MLSFPTSLDTKSVSLIAKILISIKNSSFLFTTKMQYVRGSCYLYLQNAQNLTTYYHIYYYY